MMRIATSTMFAILILGLATVTHAHMKFYEPCPRPAVFVGDVCQMPLTMNSWTKSSPQGYYGVGGPRVTYATSTTAIKSCAIGSSEAVRTPGTPHYSWTEGQSITTTFGLEVDHFGNEVNVGYFHYDSAYDASKPTEEPSTFFDHQISLTPRDIQTTTKGRPAFVTKGNMPSRQFVLPLGSAKPWAGLYADHMQWHSCVDAEIKMADYKIVDQATGNTFSKVIQNTSVQVALNVDVIQNDASRAVDITSVSWSPQGTGAQTTYPYVYTLNPNALAADTTTFDVVATIAYANGRTVDITITVEYNELCGTESTSSYTCDQYYHPRPNKQCQGAECDDKTHCCRANDKCSSDYTQSDCVAVDPLTSLVRANMCNTPTCNASQCCTDNPTCGESSVVCDPTTSYKHNLDMRCPTSVCLPAYCCTPVKKCRTHTCTGPTKVSFTEDGVDGLDKLCNGECDDTECCDDAGQCPLPTTEVPKGMCIVDNYYPKKNIVYADFYCATKECKNNECCYTTTCAASFTATSCPYTTSMKPNPETLPCSQDPCLPADCCQASSVCNDGTFSCNLSVEFDANGKRHTFHKKSTFNAITCATIDGCTQSECCDPNDSCDTYGACPTGYYNPLTAATPTAADVVSLETTPRALRRLMQTCVAAENPAPAACPDGSSVGTLDTTKCLWDGCTSGRNGCNTAECATTECCLMNQTCSRHVCADGMVPKKDVDVTKPCLGADCLDAECCIAAPSCEQQSEDVCGSVPLVADAATVMCATHTCTFGRCCQTEFKCGTFDCSAAASGIDAASMMDRVGDWTSNGAEVSCRDDPCLMDECCTAPPLRDTCAGFACPLPKIPVNLSDIKMCAGIACDESECCVSRGSCPANVVAYCAEDNERKPLDNASLIGCSTQLCVYNECCEGVDTELPKDPKDPDGPKLPSTCQVFVDDAAMNCAGDFPDAVRDPSLHNCRDAACTVEDCCRAAPTMPTCSSMIVSATAATTSSCPAGQMIGDVTKMCFNTDCVEEECCVPLTCRDYVCPSDQPKLAAAATTLCTGAVCTPPVCCEEDGGGVEPFPSGSGPGRGSKIPNDDEFDKCPTTVDANDNIVDCNGDIVDQIIRGVNGEPIDTGGYPVDPTTGRRTGDPPQQGEAVDEEDSMIGVIVGVVVVLLVCCALVLFFLWKRSGGAPSTMRAKNSSNDTTHDDLTGEQINEPSSIGNSQSISVDQGDDLRF